MEERQRGKGGTQIRKRLREVLSVVLSFLNEANTENAQRALQGVPIMAVRKTLPASTHKPGVRMIHLEAKDYGNALMGNHGRLRMLHDHGVNDLLPTAGFAKLGCE
jgi:hypothetical protein